MSKVLFVCYDDDVREHVSVNDNMTVRELVESRVSRPVEEYSIKVNRLPVAMDYVLKDDDRITLTPRKIEGA